MCALCVGLKLDRKHQALSGQRLPTSKFVASFRDPKESFVSGFYMYSGIMGFSMDRFGIDDYIDVMFADLPSIFHGAKAFVRHDVGVWQRRHNDNVFFVRYRDLVRDSEDTIEKLAEFVNVAVTPSQLGEVVKKCSFSYMTTISHKFSLTPFSLGDSGVNLVRSGKIGNSKELLTPKQAKYIDERMQEMYHAADPSFPYAEMYLE